MNYKVLTHRAHCGHQYELWKLGHQFNLVSNPKDPISSGWGYSMRPFPSNGSFVSISNVKPDEYDLAILHFDENALKPNHPKVPEGWGSTFKWILENTNIPKIAICHGTPQIIGIGEKDHKTLNCVIDPDRRKRMVDYLGDTPVVCNSHQAQKEWQFNNSTVIWHGFDPKEFLPSTYKKKILTTSEGAILQRPNYRGAFMYYNTVGHLKYKPEFIQVKEPPQTPKEPNIYARQKFKNYVDTLREFSIYFNPTIRSPMPRSRGEAMMCGLVSVNADNHDVDRFIVNGVNGYRSNNPKELKEAMEYLIENPEVLKKMGKNSRDTAIKYLHVDRFLNDWKNLIKKVVK